MEQSLPPSNVTKFEILVYLSLGLGIVNAILMFDQFVTTSSVGFVLGVQAFTFFVVFLLTWAAARRRQNWARWVLAVLVIMGIFAFIPTASATWRENNLVAVINSIQLFLQGGAIYFVFSGDAAQWFKRSAV